MGLVFSLLGLVLYRIRNLECAGSAVAFPILRPVFQVLCAVFVAAAAQFFLYNFLGLNRRNFLILSVGLTVGWFIGKMLTEHTTRVFNLKNCYGLVALAAVFAVSLWMTHVDILRVETRLPDPEKIRYVQFGGKQYTEREDIENFLRLQADALEHRAEEPGTYVLVDGQWIGCFGENYDKYLGEGLSGQYRYTCVDNENLTYELKNGKLIKRHYNIWVDTEYVESEAGRIAEDYLTRWDHINSRTIMVKGVEYDRLDWVLQDLEEIYVDYMEDSETLRKELSTPSNARSLIAAIKADCAEGNMAQMMLYHTGSFRVENEYAEDGYAQFMEIGISISGNDSSWWICVYPDSIHTLQWLESHGALGVEVMAENICHG